MRMLGYTRARGMLEMPANRGPAPIQERTLLLLEPDHLTRWCVSQRLAPWFHVDEAASVADAMRRLADGHYEVLLVAAADTPRALERLEDFARRHSPEIRIIRLVTEAVAATDRGGVTCIEKPFSLERLSEAVGICESKNAVNPIRPDEVP